MGSEAESQASPPWYKAAMNTNKGSGPLAVYEGWKNWNWPKVAPEFSLRRVNARVSLGVFGRSDSARPKPNSSHPLEAILC